MQHSCQIGQIELAQLGHLCPSGVGVADDPLDGLPAGLGRQAAKEEANMPRDGRAT